MLHSTDCPLHRSPSRSQRSRQFAAMQLFMASDNGVDHRDSDASPDVPQQIVKAAGIANFFVLQESHRGRRQGYEDASRTKTANQNGPQKCPLPNRKIDLPEPQTGTPEQ